MTTSQEITETVDKANGTIFSGFHKLDPVVLSKMDENTKLINTEIVSERKRKQRKFLCMGRSNNCCYRSSVFHGSFDRLCGVE